MDAKEIADRIAIRDLIDRYSLGVTMRDASMISGVFSEDAEWRCGAPLDTTRNGAANIGTQIAGGLARFGFLVQMVHSAVIDVDGDRATARCVMQEVGRTADDAGGIQMYGLYHDELQREPQGWRFTRRFFQPINVDPAAPGGTLASGNGARV